MKTGEGNFNNDAQFDRISPEEIHDKNLPNVYEVNSPEDVRQQYYNEADKLYVHDNDQTKDNSKFAFIVPWQMRG